MKNRNAKDVSLVIISLFICAVALGYFAILHVPQKMEERKTVAALNVINGSCFIKQSETDSWVKAKNENKLAYGNIVKLDSLAAAEINFENGTKLSLLEDSLIEIQNQDGALVIIVKGNCTGLDIHNLAYGTVIKTDNENILNVQSDSDARVSVKEKTVNASVARGKIIVETADGVEKSVLQGSGFVMDFEGAMQRKPVIVTSPLCFEQVAGSEGKSSVNFNWNINNSNVHFIKVEIFKDKNMQDVVYETIESSDKNSCTVNLSNGLYFWRVSAYGADGAVIENPEKFQSGKFLIK